MLTATYSLSRRSGGRARRVRPVCRSLTKQKAKDGAANLERPLQAATLLHYLLFAAGGRAEADPRQNGG
jgi:hypothetical protein